MLVHKIRNKKNGLFSSGNVEKHLFLEVGKVWEDLIELRHFVTMAGPHKFRDCEIITYKCELVGRQSVDEVMSAYVQTRKKKGNCTITSMDEYKRRKKYVK